MEGADFPLILTPAGVVQIWYSRNVTAAVSQNTRSYALCIIFQLGLVDNVLSQCEAGTHSYSTYM